MCQGCPVSGSLEHDLEASPDPASPTSLWGEGTSGICLFWGGVVLGLAGVLALLFLA